MRDVNDVSLYIFLYCATAIPPTPPAVPSPPSDRACQTPREPPINRSELFARLLHLTLVAPEASEAHGGVALVSLYFGTRAHAPIIGGEMTIPLAARSSSCRRSRNALPHATPLLPKVTGSAAPTTLQLASDPRRSNRRSFPAEDVSVGTVTTMRRLAVRIKAGQACANVLDDDRSAHNKTTEAKQRPRMLIHRFGAKNINFSFGRSFAMAKVILPSNCLTAPATARYSAPCAVRLAAEIGLSTLFPEYRIVPTERLKVIPGPDESAETCVVPIVILVATDIEPSLTLFDTGTDIRGLAMPSDRRTIDAGCRRYRGMVPTGKGGRGGAPLRRST